MEITKELLMARKQDYVNQIVQLQGKVLELDAMIALMEQGEAKPDLKAV